ncbi:N-acetylmuramoyl-L-alanine amidase CwlD [Clostridium tyrobutyricum]|jgi:N-acetylmuramoyl-L-alanine amidase|uniref:N-acetylmuramoyl-L-alanine amidase n=1 Tax=Clostridium tyrobutyricum DIVETGP TaxID=1408889 RepID=W6NEC3_CLOTY|nr:N-acetylmuramoyl-L-alanine amidase CwlD [Clostridium tyrobutyricum]AND86091.1 N-acetylmuramoyl-L-alanine amidase CwlD [Clostridium tyrobutyricum]ANP70590.1 N-acetylmuramoyl-L-alanine amidase CwlD [Clostridium tyrobutyricum]MBV4416834.1 N-acetylmuramoyl-L-alanine amidase CwlD [Clostridium tyrobutyricum]MBV4422239.1 N-acetylmuramoyl-L-alanine amidase CwlD [Clostridium tyrobutyricum]MBV4425693.1 N-acetylmuramoyl-L-alanine amidase CwlD [Clostridium tyrobutyricum]
MKKVNKKIFVTMIICGLFLVFFQNIVYSNSLNKKKDIIILIDPGHGGIDGGAESKDGIKEKDINLKISNKLKNTLKKRGYKIVMTRENDTGLYTENGRIRKKKVEDLNNRAKMKKDTKCNMFISIHLNMFPQSKYYGAQVWYSKNEKSKIFAKILQNNLKKDLDKDNDRQEKAALNSYKILRENDTMPSVIVECGFLSNDREREKLASDKYQDSIASSISNSIDEYYNNQD